MNDLERFELESKIERILFLSVGSISIFLGFVFVAMLFSQMPNRELALWPIILLLGIGSMFLSNELKYGKKRRVERRMAIIAGMEMEAKIKDTKSSAINQLDIISKTIKCPVCGNIQNIISDIRPIEIKCKNCNRHIMVRG